MKSGYLSLSHAFGLFKMLALGEVEVKGEVVPVTY
jgi:hypothetical protein